MARIDKDEITKFFDHGIYLASKTIAIGDENNGIDGTLSNGVIKGLHVLDRIYPDKPITVLLNSAGGDTHHGLAIYDAIRECESEVHIKVYGQAMSMAAWILQAGDRRLVSPNSRIMIHTGNSTFSDHNENIKRLAKQMEKDELIFEDILLNRIREKNPTFSRSKLRKMLMFDSVLSPQEAVDMGLADAVIGDE